MGRVDSDGLTGACDVSPAEGLAGSLEGSPVAGPVKLPVSPGDVQGTLSGPSSAKSDVLVSARGLVTADAAGDTHSAPSFIIVS